MKLTLMKWSGSWTCWMRSDGIDHVEDRRVAQVEQRVLLQARELLACQAELGRPLLDRRLDVLPARVDQVDLGLRRGLLLLELREAHRPLVEVLPEAVELLLRRRRGLRLVGQRVLVLVERRVEGRLRELVGLVRGVDLGVELADLRLGLAQVAGLLRDLGPRSLQLPDELRVLLVDRLPPRGERRTRA